jgi:hypothetical protein
MRKWRCSWWREVVSFKPQNWYECSEKEWYWNGWNCTLIFCLVNTFLSWMSCPSNIQFVSDVFLDMAAWQKRKITNLLYPNNVRAEIFPTVMSAVNNFKWEWNKWEITCMGSLVSRDTFLHDFALTWLENLHHFLNLHDIIQLHAVWNWRSMAALILLEASRKWHHCHTFSRVYGWY